MKKILIITAGGTIGMIPNSKTGALEPAKDPLAFLKLMPDLAKLAKIELEQVMNIDSSNMAQTEWEQIAKTIYKNYNQFDGFVVIQGTDTLAYSASALSFTFQDLNKPIVFTGSLLPAFELGSDAINNLIYACMTATQDIAEVCLVFSNKILRANRSKKHHESFLVGFHSPVFPNLGELGRPIKLNDWRNKKSKTRKLKFKPKFDNKVGVVKLYPGFNPLLLTYYLEQKYKAIFIEGFGSGNIPFLKNSIVPMIETLTKNGIIVAIGNQMEKGKTNLNAYQAGRKALEAGAISNQDMTSEASITKLMWLCANKTSVKAIKEGFEQNLAGEISLI
jgi:L-asparaginase